MTTQGLLTTFPISTKDFPTDGSISPQINPDARPRSPFLSTVQSGFHQPQISSFPHPVTDLRCGDCGERRPVTSLTFPLLQWQQQCLGLSLSGVAQCLLLLSRWTLGYASLPSNPIEGVQSVCNTVSYPLLLCSATFSTSTPAYTNQQPQIPQCALV